jgi:hypothetical protein
MSTYASGAPASRRSVGAIVFICFIVLAGCGWDVAMVTVCVTPTCVQLMPSDERHALN